jgi:hypothetical protein
LPSGIADPKGRVGFFASATGGIEAIELSTGKVLWHTNEAQQPLLVDGHHLLAQAGVKRNRLRILRFDLTRNGECDLESDPVVFPAWVVTGEAHGHSFSSHWRLKKNQFVMSWESSAWYVGTTKPTPEQIQAARKRASGVALIDLRSGQVEVRPAPSASPSSGPELPDYLERKAVRWQGIIGHHWKVLTLEEKDGQQILVLHSWDRDSEKADPPKELLKGKHLVARASLDERVLWLRETGPRPGERGLLLPAKETVWWWLFSAKTGELMGRVPDEAGMQSLVVLGKQAYYLMPGPLHGRIDRPTIQPRTVKAIDLSTGKKLWEHPVAGKLLAPPSP